MTLEFRAITPAEIGDEAALLIPVFQDGDMPASLPDRVRTIVERVVAQTRASGLYAVTTHLTDEDALPQRLVIVGAGARADFTAERARSVAAAGTRSLWRSTVTSLAVAVPDGGLAAEHAVQQTVEGILFALWRPEAHRTREEERSLPPIARIGLLTDAAVEAPVARGIAIGEAVNLCRRLANEPANLMTPTILAAEAQRIAAAVGLECEILGEDACRALGMGSFLSVAQGSAEPPAFIVLRYRGGGGVGYDLGLVGKGITFDSGGISIKPADDMHKMKADMTGAATVIAAMRAIATLKPALDVIAVAACTENLPGGRATKPGDVFTSMSGRTVEVINTDAEGRLVLIDGLTYVQREGATRVVDVATLTGAIRIALGGHYVGLFGKPDAWVDAVRTAGTGAGDRLWPMPLTDEYREEVKSDIADLRNSVSRHGGAIFAAAFLDAVIDDGVSWAHLDISSMAWADKDRPHAPKGPQAPGVRTLVALAEAVAAGG